MNDYTGYMINNNQAKSRAKTAEKKQSLRNEIKKMFNYNASKCLTIKELSDLLSGGMTI